MLIVYKAEVITSNLKTKIYIRYTFKERFNNHKKSFSKIKIRVACTNQWSILKRATSRISGGRSCNLCMLAGEAFNLNANKSNLLNKKCEVFSQSCVDQKRFLAGKFNYLKYVLGKRILK